MVKDPDWLAYARQQIGVREIKGPRHEPKIIAWAKRAGRWLGIDVRDDETPWCGTFAAACVLHAGFDPPRIAVRAKAWASFGGPISLAATRPPLGAIAVFERKGGGHVGFVAEVHSDGSLGILGGNQGDAVNIRRFARHPSRTRPDLRLIALRWPLGAPMADSAPWATTRGVTTTGEG